MLWFVISTSSPQSSVALFRDRELVFHDSTYAPRSAGSACGSMIESLCSSHSFDLGSVDLFVADVGPGSFTGVRVGVMMVKVFGYVYEKRVAGLSAFSLIAPGGYRYIPSRKDEFFVYDGTVLKTVSGKDLVGGPGYGHPDAPDVYPEASRAGVCYESLEVISCFELTPSYHLEPHISQPKTPYKERSI
jgi:tRNA A37 threonylcarbamoyladenosine modification protein TsaB